MSIITKGLIGLEDLSLGVGTFTRSNSTGGTIVLTKIGSFPMIVGSLSSNFTANTYNMNLVTTGASAIMATLPTAVGISGTSLIIKKVDSGVGTVVITPAGSQKIDGLSTFTLSAQWQYIGLVSDGTNWQIFTRN